MLSQSQRDYYLYSMGVLRFAERKQSVVFFSVHARAGLLTLVSYIAGATASLQEQLWNNIINALQHIKAQDVQPSDRMIVFGQDAAKKIKATHSQVTYSLAALIEQPQHKAEVWDVITDKIMGSP